MQNIAFGRFFAAAGAVTLVMISHPARASVTLLSFDESTFTVSGPGNNAFCNGNGSVCDFKGGTGGNGAGSVNAPNIAGTTSGSIPGPGSNFSFQPMLASGSPTIIGQTTASGQTPAGVLEWWTPGTYGSSTVANGARTNFALPIPTIGTGTTQLFSNTSFFPPGGNDTSSFLTAEFTGKFTVGAGNTLSFSGSVDDNVLIYWRPDGSTGAYTLLSVTPNNLSNQPLFDFTSASLGTGTYDFEIFYADRSSTQASFTLDADVTAAVPEPSTWAMMILGFLGLGFTCYRRRSTISLKGV
jgi:hypothetical protein